MKILFVASGNAKYGIGEVVKNQADSLFENDVNIQIFPIIGRGYKGYINNILVLRSYLKKNHFDIIHAHYSFCLIVSFLSKTKEKLGISFMGTDLLEKNTFQQKVIFYISKWIAIHKCAFIIVKTQEMANVLLSPKVIKIANGVNLKDFYPMDKNEARDYLNIDRNIKLIIFVSNPSRFEKNYQLAINACEKVNKENTDELVLLLPVYNKSKEELKYFYSAADLLLLTSLYEGGVNVVKEAMACNCPIVSTNVGDVSDVISATNGCYLCSFEPEDVANKIKKAIQFGVRTNGRDAIIELKMDSNSVAKKIKDLYKILFSDVWHLRDN